MHISPAFQKISPAKTWKPLAYTNILSKSLEIVDIFPANFIVMKSLPPNFLKLRNLPQNIKPQQNTLKEESVCGRKFCGFCGFVSNRKSLFPQNIVILVNRKSFFPPNIHNYHSCIIWVFSRAFSRIFTFEMICLTLEPQKFLPQKRFIFSIRKSLFPQNAKILRFG